jgi:hypothetical protein
VSLTDGPFRGQGEAGYGGNLPVVLSRLTLDASIVCENLDDCGGYALTQIKQIEERQTEEVKLNY